MIELKNITRTFRDTVLDDVSLTFEPGKLYVVKGVSGCGKTTLLNIIAGFDSGYSGEYRYQNVLLSGKKNRNLEKHRKNIGYICQQSLLVGTLTVRENLEFISCGNAKLPEYAGMFGIEEYLDNMPGQLSGGQRQRVAVVRTLLQETDIIVADEPTSSLDYENSLMIVEQLVKLKKLGKTVIVASHKDIMDDLADEVIELSYGVVRERKINVLKEEKLEKKKEKIEENTLHQDRVKTENKRDRSLHYDLKYIRKKTKPQKTVSSVLIFSLMFTFLFGVFSVKNNLMKEYVRISNQENHYNVLQMDDYSLERLQKIFECKVYQPYEIRENGIVLTGLFEKEDSAFSDESHLAWGHYPQNDNEILVNEMYAQNENIGIDQSVTVKIKEKSYQVAGVVKNRMSGYTISEYGYCEQMQMEECVFLTQSEIEKWNGQNEYDITEGYMVAIHAEDLYTNPKYVKIMTSLSPEYSNWKDYIRNQTAELQYIADTTTLILLLAGIVILFFMLCKISIDLFYRQRELGYLQLFRVTRKRICFLVGWGYLRIILASQLLCMILFEAGVIYVKAKTGYNYSLDGKSWILLHGGILVYVLLCIGIPLRKYMAKDPVQLVKTNV